jgi:hypothetical protein
MAEIGTRLLLAKKPLLDLGSRAVVHHHHLKDQLGAGGEDAGHAFLGEGQSVINRNDDRDLHQ